MSSYFSTWGNTAVSVSYSRDSKQKEAALAKALQPEGRGHVHFLNYGTRLALVLIGKTRVARLLESIYRSGFKHGWITVKEAEELIRPHYRDVPKGLSKRIRQALEDLTFVIDENR